MLGSFGQGGIEINRTLQAAENIVEGGISSRQGNQAGFGGEYFAGKHDLQFRDVGASIGGGIHQIESPLQIAAVRAANLGDNNR